MTISISNAGNYPYFYTTTGGPDQARALSNSNGITFGVDANNNLTASHNALTVQSNQTVGIYASSNTTLTSSGTLDARSFSVRGAGIVSVGYSANELVISATGGGGGLTNINVSAGTTSQNLSNFVLSNSNNVSFGLDGSTFTANAPIVLDDQIGVSTKITYLKFGTPAVGTLPGNVTFGLVTLTSAVGSFAAILTASAPAGGGGVTNSLWYPYHAAGLVAGSQGQATLQIMPLQHNGAKAFDRVAFPVNFSNSSNSSGSLTLSMWMGFYTKNGSTLSLLHSSSTSNSLGYAGNNSSSNQRGLRLFTMGWTTTITEGQYFVGVVSRSTTAGTNATLAQLLVSHLLATNWSGMWDVASNKSVQFPLGLGILSVSTAGIPASIAFTDINGTGTLAQRPPNWFAMSQTA